MARLFQGWSCTTRSVCALEGGFVDGLRSARTRRGDEEKEERDVRLCLLAWRAANSHTIPRTRRMHEVGKLVNHLIQVMVLVIRRARVAMLGKRRYGRGCAEFRTYRPFYEIGTVTSDQIMQCSYPSRRTPIATAAHGQGVTNAQIFQRVYYCRIVRKF